MEEVDGILIYTLKQIGCDVDSKISELSSQQLIQCVLKCLSLIRPDDTDIPTYDSKMPMSNRFKIAQHIAQILTDMGYTGEIECQSLLYPTEADTRKVLIFVVEKLPREADIGDQIDSLQLQIAKRSSIGGDGDGDNDADGDENASSENAFGNGFEVGGIRLPTAVDINQLPKETLKFYASHLAELTFEKERKKYRKPAVVEPVEEDIMRRPVVDIEDDDDDFGDPDEPPPQPLEEKEEIIPSKPEKPAIAEKPKKKPPVAQKPNLSKVPTEEEKAAAEAEELGRRAAAEAAEKLKALQEDSKNKAITLQQRQKQLQEMNQKMNAMKEQISRLKEELPEKEKLLARQRKTHQLINGDENGLDKLKSGVEAQVEKLLKLSTQWETHRKPLVDQIRSKQESGLTGDSEATRIRDEIKSLKTQLKEMGQEAKLKEAANTKLLAEYEKMSKDLNRSSYTRRITEIIGNIKKQKREIKKILQDTKQIQKDINTLSGRLDRTFAVADELIFKDAEKDKNVAQSYKLLVAIHSDFSKIINTLEEAGNLRRQSRDLEDKLELEKGKSVEDKLKRLRADISQMQKENRILEARLRDPTLERNKKQ